MSRVLFYAMGGGFGHLTRTRHLLSELRRRTPVESLVLCPRRAVGWVQRFSWAAGIDKVSRTELGSWVAAQTLAFRPDLLVVDTFPRGVLGELEVPAGLPRVLVARWGDPRFYLHPPVRRALESYSEVCWTEPRPHSQLPGQDCGPVLDEEEPLSREQARQLWPQPWGRPLVLGLGSGPAKAQQALVEQLRQAGLDSVDIHWCSRELGTSRPELGRLLRAADVVVTASGYNSYYEVARAQVPALWTPQSRLVDNQRLRAEGAFPFAHRGPQKILEPGQELAPILSSLLEAGPTSSPWEAPRGREQVGDVLVRQLTKGNNVR